MDITRNRWNGKMKEIDELFKNQEFKTYIQEQLASGVSIDELIRINQAQ